MANPDPMPDPHGTLAWINAVIETIKQAYVALFVPLGALVVWFVRRADRAQERAEAKQKSEEEAHQRIADQLDQDSSERFAAMKDEIASLRRERAELQAEVNRLLALVRRWYDLAHHVRHEAGRMLQRLFRLMERDGMTPPEMEMPSLSYDPDQP